MAPDADPSAVVAAIRAARAAGGADSTVGTDTGPAAHEELAEGAGSAQPAGPVEVHLALDLRGLDLARREEALGVGPVLGALRAELAGAGALPDLWLTLVEPWAALVAAPGAEGSAAPPWLGDPGIVVRAHHAVLAHGAAVAALRVADDATRIGVVLDLAVHIAADDDHGPDHDAVHAANLVRNHLLVGPLLEGALPVELVRETAREAPWSVVLPGDLARVRVRLDVLGMTPPEAWVLDARPHPALLGSPVEVRRADPADAAQALHDQLRAFDVAHEGTPLVVDLRGLPDAGGVTRELAEAALARAREDEIPVRAVG